MRTRALNMQMRALIMRTRALITSPITEPDKLRQSHAVRALNAMLPRRPCVPARCMVHAAAVQRRLHAACRPLPFARSTRGGLALRCVLLHERCGGWKRRSAPSRTWSRSSRPSCTSKPPDLPARPAPPAMAARRRKSCCYRCARIHSDCAHAHLGPRPLRPFRLLHNGAGVAGAGARG